MHPTAYPIKFFNTTYFAIFALWTALWLSLNAESATSEDPVLFIFHQCRLLLPYGAAIAGVFWIFKLRVMPEFQIWQVGVLGYAGTVLISSFIAGLEYQNIHFHAAMVCAIVVTICVNAVSRDLKQPDEKHIILTLMFAGFSLLAITFTVFFLRDLVVAIQHNIYYGYAVHGVMPVSLGMEAPRATGNARTAAILGLFCLISYCFGILKHRVFYFVACFCLTAVIFYQARASMVALIFTIGLLLKIIPTSCRPSLLDSMKFCVIVVSMFLTIWLVIHLPNYFEQSTTLSDKPQLFRNLIGVDSFSGGRFDFWVSGLEAFFGSPYFGLGGQADRLHIDHNVSSLVLYILMCGGIMGLAFAVITVLRPIKLIWSLTRCQPVLERDPESGITVSAVAIFVFLSVRGIFENSYSLFNIDFVLVVPVVWFLHLQHKKMQDCKSGNNLQDRAPIQ